jgi:predicted dehydrogenase
MNIGFIDYYLDNWHANYYPGFLREAAAKFGYEINICGAYAVKDKEGGMTTRQWCEERQIKPFDSMSEVMAQSDALMVIAADDSRFHDFICPEALTCGKPVFVDKTFAKDIKSGKDFFAIASAHRTPVFSASAQRYCQSIIDYLAEPNRNTRFMSTVGPFDLASYAIHQLEPIIAVMGTGIKRVKCFSVGSQVTNLLLDYMDGRLASLVQTPQPWAEFNFMVSDGETGRRLPSDEKNFYENLMRAILQFFETGVSPVQQEETLEALAVIELAMKHRDEFDTWIDIGEFL